MPLTSPNLDDRRFEDIFNEAKKLIPRYAPEWTDWNEHDPGITMLQLFSWLTELLIYRLNQVPDKNFIEFLKLVGIELKPASPAKADLTFTIALGSGSVVIPKGTAVGLENDDAENPTVFETAEALVAVESVLKEIQVFDGAAYTLYTDTNSVVGTIYHAFGSTAGENSALYLGFDLPFPQSEVKLTIYIYTEDLISAGVHCEMDENQVFPSAKVVWEYYNGGEWRELEVLKDSTRWFMQSGDIYFKGPSTMAASKQGQSQTQDYYWIRCRVVEPGYEVPPRIDSILLNSVSAANVTTMKGEMLGSSDGTPGQTFTLRHTPIIAGSLVLQVDEGSGWKTWKEVDTLSASGRDEEHFILNRSTGEIFFGDGLNGRVPLPITGGRNIMALVYQYGGGTQGNVGKETITALQSSVPGVTDVTNYRPAQGGDDEESVAAAMERGPMELKTRHRAVTLEDFEFLARETPGVRVRRAKALPLYHPSFPNCKMPGVVTVIIVPESKEAKPMPGEGLLKTVCQHLNKHRLITNEVYVIPPQYVKIKVEAGIVAKADADAMTVKQGVDKNLTAFFHPLEGGSQGNGWGFGGDIFFSDVYKEILDVKGVERIETVTIYKDDIKQDQCKNIEIPGDCLLYSDEHDLDVYYERV